MAFLQLQVAIAGEIFTVGGNTVWKNLNSLLFFRKFYSNGSQNVLFFSSIVSSKGCLTKIERFSD